MGVSPIRDKSPMFWEVETSILTTQKFKLWCPAPHSGKTQLILTMCPLISVPRRDPLHNQKAWRLLKALFCCSHSYSLTFCQIYLLTGSLQRFDLSSCHQD